MNIIGSSSTQNFWETLLYIGLTKGEKSIWLIPRFWFLVVLLEKENAFGQMFVN
jgi:hypothetical protein